MPNFKWFYNLTPYSVGSVFSTPVRKHRTKKPWLLFVVLLVSGIWTPNAVADRWKIDSDDSGITWDVAKDKDLPHDDHIEMSGRYVSAIISYGADAKGDLTLSRRMIWPMLRTLPEHTRACIKRDYKDPVAEPVLLVNGKPAGTPKLTSAKIDGRLVLVTELEPGLEVTRDLFPAMRLPMLLETWTIKNTTGKSMELTVKAPEIQDELTEAKQGKYGSYRLGVKTEPTGTFTLAPGKSQTVTSVYFGLKQDEKLPDPLDVAKLSKQRSDFVKRQQENLVLKTPDPVLNQLFAFAKVRAAESIFDTAGGLMHAPGGGQYYAAIWANDQAEYVNPFFPYLGDEDGNESAINSFRHFARYMNDDYRGIPSSIIAEGEGFWNGAGDRGDMAMIAYGASRFALVYGDKEQGEKLWPLIEWCLEYCHRKITKDGVVASNSDELEGRFPSGDANLCTSCLYYDALVSAAKLGRDLGKPAEQIDSYAQQAEAVRKAIGDYFEADVEGYKTYCYYDGNDVLRAWICIPLTVGIYDRKDGTLDALFSDRLWTDDGLATKAGKETFWDRSTLYALRGVLASGETARGLEYLDKYSRRRLLGDHVPYPVEAYPEGGQAHLSAESGLYCRIFIEGLFGIRPTGLREFSLTPRLPKDWNEMELKEIHGFGGKFDCRVERVGEKLRVLVTSGEKTLLDREIQPGETVTVKR